MRLEFCFAISTQLDLHIGYRKFPASDGWADTFGTHTYRTFEIVLGPLQFAIEHVTLRRKPRVSDSRKA